MGITDKFYVIEERISRAPFSSRRWESETKDLAMYISLDSIIFLSLVHFVIFILHAINEISLLFNKKIYNGSISIIYELWVSRKCDTPAP